MALTDAQRRVIGHLAIPHNAEQLSLDIHPHVDLSPEDVDLLLRGDLSDNGWVQNLGSHSDPAKAAATAQKHKATIDMSDEQCALYEKRRQPNGRYGWRLKGDLWQVTKEGNEQMHAPIDVGRGPLTPTEIQNVVEQEWARTLKEPYDPNSDQALGPYLLQEEFNNFFKTTHAHCEKTWGAGSGPVAPLAGGSSGYSDAYEVSSLDQENQKTAIGAVATPWYMALSIYALTDADTGTTCDDGTRIPTYTTYARKSVAAADMNAGSGASGSVTNANAIIFGACTVGSSTIIACANCVAATVGVMRKWGDVGSTVVSITQTPPQFAINAYTTTIT